MKGNKTIIDATALANSGTSLATQYYWSSSEIDAEIIEIVNIYGDATAVTNDIKYPMKLKAILLVYHNGAYYTAGFTEKKNEFVAIDLSKIVYAFTSTGTCR